MVRDTISQLTRVQPLDFSASLGALELLQCNEAFAGTYRTIPKSF